MAQRNGTIARDFDQFGLSWKINNCSESLFSYSTGLKCLSYDIKGYGLALLQKSKRQASSDQQKAAEGFCAGYPKDFDLYDNCIQDALAINVTSLTSDVQSAIGGSISQVHQLAVVSTLYFNVTVDYITNTSASFHITAHPDFVSFSGSLQQKSEIDTSDCL